VDGNWRSQYARCRFLAGQRADQFLNRGGRKSDAAMLGANMRAISVLAFICLAASTVTAEAVCPNPGRPYWDYVLRSPPGGGLPQLGGPTERRCIRWCHRDRQIVEPRGWFSPGWIEVLSPIVCDPGLARIRTWPK
jgi:hypothetical protein